MFTQTPQHIIENERKLLDIGMARHEIDILKGHVELIAISHAQADEAITSTRIMRAIREISINVETRSPNIEAIISAFAKRYHLYITQNEQVIAADNFKKDLVDAMPSLPQGEVLYMARKIITAVSHKENDSPNAVYREVLSLIHINPKKVTKAEIFHGIIDMYVQKLLSEGPIRHQDSAYAWVSLDGMARVLVTDKEFPYHTKPEKLTKVGCEIQKALRIIVQGIQTRNTEMIRKGVHHDFIENEELGIIANELLGKIEQYIH